MEPSGEVLHEARSLAFEDGMARFVVWETDLRPSHDAVFERNVEGEPAWTRDVGAWRVVGYGRALGLGEDLQDRWRMDDPIVTRIGDEQGHMRSDAVEALGRFWELMPIVGLHLIADAAVDMKVRVAVFERAETRDEGLIDARQRRARDVRAAACPDAVSGLQTGYPVEVEAEQRRRRLMVREGRGRPRQDLVGRGSRTPDVELIHVRPGLL
ncbi:MAG: hypothetical protein J0I07_18230, partial [Myxococcales bacterium]|nr:hypothetical protein [Myxococcales bacterium]